MNKKGFALIETLIAAVAVMVIFSVMFMNFYPLIGEYEKSEHYNTVDSKYMGYWVRRLLLSPSNKSLFNSLTGCSGSCRIITSCSSLSDQSYCSGLFSKAGITKIYITKNNITNFKSYVKTNMDSDRQLQEYVQYLPNYSGASCYNYRLIYEYKQDVNDNSNNKKEFGTIGVTIS